MVSYGSSDEKEQQRNRSENSLHSIQRGSSSSSSKAYKKPLNMLAHLASGTNAAAITTTTSQPRVYKVKPIHFRELVQRLTGASPELNHHQPQPQANTPLSISPYNLDNSQNQSHRNHTIVEEQVPYKVEQAFPDKKDGGEGTTEVTLSPSFQAWFSLALSSPGSVL